MTEVPLKGKPNTPAAARAGKGENQQERKRSFVARSLGAILPSVTAPAFRKPRAPLVWLMLDWEEIVGPAFARACAPRRLSAGTLTVACSGPVAMEIQHQAPQLLERINTRFARARHAPQQRGEPAGIGVGTILRLKIVQEAFAPIVQPHAPPPSRRGDDMPPAAVIIPDRPEGELGEALERLGRALERRRTGFSR